MDIRYINQFEPTNKTILLRVDFNVSMTKNNVIEDDFRVKQVLPTIELLLKNNNSLILLSHLGKPKGIEPQFSLVPVVSDLRQYFKGYDIRLVKTVEEVKTVEKTPKTILVLENIRFFEGEKGNTGNFAKDLSTCAHIFVNDAFSVCHREDASVVGLPNFLPSYGGLLMQKEITALFKILEKPEHPFVVVMGGAKVSTKIGVIKKMLDTADTILVGGGIANTFLKSRGIDIKNSLYEESMLGTANELYQYAEKHHNDMVLPEDYVWGGTNLKINNGNDNHAILDIGPKTIEKYTNIIKSAKTIVWNGPMGLAEDERYRSGTLSVLQAMAENVSATTVLGGGDTIAILKDSPYLSKIFHVSTGGGAMLEYIEKNGDLPGLKALYSNNR